MKAYHFSDFEESDFIFNHHFECKNDKISIDIAVDAMSYAPISVSINLLTITLLEPENVFLKEYYQKAEQYYIDFDLEYKKDKRKLPDTLREEYRVLMKNLNDQYLEEIARILNRNPNVLKGDISVLKENHSITVAKSMKELQELKSKDQIYTCDFTIDNGIGLTYESTSLEEIRKYLIAEDYKTFLDFTVYDWNNQKIDLKLD